VNGHTVNSLIKALQEIKKGGADGNIKVFSWDPDSEQWENVRGFAYSDDELRFYTDEE